MAKMKKGRSDVVVCSREDVWGTLAEMTKEAEMKKKRDPDRRGSEYRVAMVQTGEDVERLGQLSRRGWSVAVVLSPSKVLLVRGEGWND